MVALFSLALFLFCVLQKLFNLFFHLLGPCIYFIFRLLFTKFYSISLFHFPFFFLLFTNFYSVFSFPLSSFFSLQNFYSLFLSFLPLSFFIYSFRKISSHFHSFPPFFFLSSPRNFTHLLSLSPSLSLSFLLSFKWF